MSGLGILVILIVVSSVPAIAVYLWFRIVRCPFSPLRFVLCLLAGAAAFFPALFLQWIFPDGTRWAVGKGGLIFSIFIRGAFTEELSRLFALGIMCGVDARLRTVSTGADRTQARWTAAGLVSGLGFAILEGAAYGASDAGTVLIRAVTAAPLHGACGARVGSAVALFRQPAAVPARAVFRFLSAVAIHGIYNFMIIIPGFPAIAAVVVALSAFVSSILSIRGGIQTGEGI
jgi:RsiW-degrading membrane proteinase PrsW (M82 family)